MIVLAGCGKMGGAMLEGWLKSGVDAKQIVALDPKPPEEVAAMLKANNIAHNPPLATLTAVKAIIIAVKPQMMGEVLPNLASLQKSMPLNLSIAAGKTIASFEAAFGSAASIIRTMPNTPAAIGRGITAMVGNKNVSTQQMALAKSLLSSTGEVVEVENEAMIDMVTAVSGSGPAYVFYLVECMAAAGERIGLPKELAMKLARATVSGSGELLHQSPSDASTLRQNVTSPGGTTFAALQVLMADEGMRPLFEKAITAAFNRSKELS
jgi:pyrroline-5-carboxylate reductase